LHGIAFSIILIVLVIFWSVILAILVAFGYVIGLIIGFIVLFYLLGGINVYLTGAIWGIQVKEDWKSLLRHGLVLLMGLIIVHIPAVIVALVVPSPVVTVPVLIVYGFVDGFVALHIGVLYEEEPEEANEVSDES
jgi:hypothetical protein